MELHQIECISGHSTIQLETCSYELFIKNLGTQIESEQWTQASRMCIVVCENGSHASVARPAGQPFSRLTIQRQGTWEAGGA